MKTVWKLCLALALMVAALFVMSVPAFAAGTHTVSGEFKIDEKAPAASFTFNLYNVGHFDQDKKDGKSILVLDIDVPDADLDIKEPEEGADKSEWQNAWLEQAQLVADSLSEADAKKTLCGTVKTGADGKFSFTDKVSNGLYLLVSNDKYKETEVDENGCTVIWTAQPMLVMVLDGDVELMVKPLKESVPKKYTVIKSWSDSGNESVRPKEIKVEIYYGYKTGQKNTPVETVTLNSANNWSYSWSIEDKLYVGKTEDKYTVKEVMTSALSNAYTMTQKDTNSKENNTKIFNITNNYKKSSSSNSSAKTGDQGGMWKYYCLVLAALTVLIVVFVRMRKGKNE